MKFIFIRLLTALAIMATTASAAQRPATGLLIYQNVPSTYVEAFEFVSVAKKNLFDSVVIRPTGQGFSCKTEGILAVVNYPPLFVSPENAVEALDNIKNIESLQQQYPKFKGQLQAVEVKWKIAMEAGKQMKVKEPVAQSPSAKTVIPQPLAVDSNIAEKNEREDRVESLPPPIVPVGPAQID